LITYDLIIIGAGSGGLTAALFARQLGLKTALIDKEKPGGDCTWTGCVPSKALIKAAKVAQMVRSAAKFGVMTAPPTVDMAAVKAYINQAITDIYRHETPAMLQAQGIDLFLGGARFPDAHTVEVGEQQLSGRRFIIATGASPRKPAMEGLEEIPYQTYEQIFENEQLPPRLLVMGAGAVGCEIGQAYQRLGSQVTLIDRGILPALDGLVEAALLPHFRGEGMRFVRGLVTKCRLKSSGEVCLQVGEQEVCGDGLLLAVGRKPNVMGLGLENAGIDHTPNGIQVDRTLRTNIGHIYAIGDCLGREQFTHYAAFQGAMAVRNGFLPGKSAGIVNTIPNTIFTDPEVSQVGLAEAVAREKYGHKVIVSCRPLNSIDRAITDDARAGFIQVVHTRQGKLLGATIVAPQAGELIGEFALALNQGLSVSDLSTTIHPYPTYSVGIQQLMSEQYTASLLSGVSGRLLKQMAQW